MSHVYLVVVDGKEPQKALHLYDCFKERGLPVNSVRLVDDKTIRYLLDMARREDASIQNFRKLLT